MKAEDATWVGVVLAGGASTRMGKDKALIEVGGRPLVEYAIAALDQAGASSVVVVGGDRDGFRARRVDRRARLIPDDHPGQGPLGGLVTAIDALGQTSPRSPGPITAPVGALLLLSCDLPFAHPAAISEIVDRWRVSGAEAVLPVVAGQVQYLHSLWARCSFEVVRRSFATGSRAMRAPLAELGAVDVFELDRSRSTVDVDTPADLAAVLAVGSRPSDSKETR